MPKISVEVSDSEYATIKSVAKKYRRNAKGQAEHVIVGWAQEEAAKAAALEQSQQAADAK